MSKEILVGPLIKEQFVIHLVIKCSKANVMKTVQVLDKNSNRELVTLHLSEYGFCFLPGQVSSHKWISQMGFFVPHLPEGERV